MFIHAHAYINKVRARARMAWRFFGWGIHRIYVGYSWGIHGVYVCIGYVSGMYRVCIGNVSKDSMSEEGTL